MSKHITVAEWELAGEFTKAAEPLTGDGIKKRGKSNGLGRFL